MTPSRQLAKLLQPSSGGAREPVLVVGSGVNMEAATLQQQADDNWNGLLQTIADEMGQPVEWLETLPTSNLARWESMLRYWAVKLKLEPYKAEVALQKFACEHLKKREEMAKGWLLYQEIAGARFKDIISLNFDRRIALSSDKCRFTCAPYKCAEGSHGETLYRHDLLTHARGRTTRVWYPHGDTKKYSTLKLGNRRYGFYIGVLEESIRRFGDSWRYRGGWQYDTADRSTYGAAKKWTTPFVRRDLIFLGCGLSTDEWPLWWMLRRRSLLHRMAGKKGSGSAYYLCAGSGCDGRVQELLALYGVVPLHFGKYEELWDSLRGAIAK